MTPTALAGKFVLINEPSTDQILATLLLAHGAGAPMDSEFMSKLATTLAELGFRVIRFEFDYMAARRTANKKAPPPKIEKLTMEWQTWLQKINGLLASTPLILSGKSMGGRVATLLNTRHQKEAHTYWQGVICFGYPFHPPRQPEKTRTDHLFKQMQPLLIHQGTRDALGNGDEIANYKLPEGVTLNWVPTGDHDLKPLKKSGYDHQKILEECAEICVTFVKQRARNVKLDGQ